MGDGSTPDAHMAGDRVGDGPTPDANRAGGRGPDAPTPDAHKGHHYISAGPTTPFPVGKGLMGGVCC